MEFPLGPQASFTFEELLLAGDATDPLEFEAPYILPGVRESVNAWNPRLHSFEVCNGVIHLKDEASCTRAYWPQKQLQKAIYGSVWHCVVLKKRQQPPASERSWLWQVTEDAVAIKMVSRARARRLREKMVEDPLKEVAAMQLLTTKTGNGDGKTHVVSSVEVLQDAIFIYSVMPYYQHGDLFSVVQLYNSGHCGRRSQSGMPEPVARHFFRQILMGLNHLQGMGIFHRDLSLENIMVDGDTCWIIDLGMCLRVQFAEHTSQRPTRRLLKPQGQCGKLNYIPNEILLNKDNLDGFAADLWSVGVILYIMLTGFFPFAQACRTELNYDTIVEGGLADVLKGWADHLSNEAVDLLQQMLQENPKDRLSLAEVKNHPWVSKDELHPPDFCG